MVTYITKITTWLTDKRDPTWFAAVFFHGWIIERKKKVKVDLLGVTDNGDKTFWEFCVNSAFHFLAVTRMRLYFRLLGKHGGLLLVRVTGLIMKWWRTGAPWWRGSASAGDLKRFISRRQGKSLLIILWEKKMGENTWICILIESERNFLMLRVIHRRELTTVKKNSLNCILTRLGGWWRFLERLRKRSSHQSSISVEKSAPYRF